MKKSVLYPNLSTYKQFNQIVANTLHLNKKVESNEYRIANSIRSTTETLIEHDFRRAYEYFWEEHDAPFPILKWRQCRNFQIDEIVNILEFSEPQYLDLMLYECFVVDKDVKPHFDIILAQLFKPEWQKQILEKHIKWDADKMNTRMLFLFVEDIPFSNSLLNLHKLTQYFSIQKNNPLSYESICSIWDKLSTTKKENFFYKALNNDFVYENSSNLLRGFLKPLIEYLEGYKKDVILDDLVQYIIQNRPAALQEQDADKIENLIKTHQYNCLDFILEEKNTIQKMKI